MKDFEKNEKENLLVTMRHPMLNRLDVINL